MNKLLSKMMPNFNCGSPPDKEEVHKLIAKIDFRIDDDFLDWMRACNQGVAAVSSDQYIQFWSIDDIVALNPYYSDIEEAKYLFFFATDGSNLGYAFDTANGAVVAIDFLDIGYAPPTEVGQSFSEFLQNLPWK